MVEPLKGTHRWRIFLTHHLNPFGLVFEISLKQDGKDFQSFEDKTLMALVSTDAADWTLLCRETSHSGTDETADLKGSVKAAHPQSYLLMKSYSWKTRISPVSTPHRCRTDDPGKPYRCGTLLLPFFFPSSPLKPWLTIKNALGRIILSISIPSAFDELMQVST